MIIKVLSRNRGIVQRKANGLREYIIPLITALLIMAIALALFLNRDSVGDLGNFGYLGAFLIGLVANATIIFPIPGLFLLVVLGSSFNPVLVGIAGAAGGAVGELSGYMIGYSGYRLAHNHKIYLRTEGWIKKWGSMAIFMFALVPFLPLDVIGIVAGVFRFPIWKFLGACWFGKALLYIGLAQVGAWGWETVEHFF